MESLASHPDDAPIDFERVRKDIADAMADTIKGDKLSDTLRDYLVVNNTDTDSASPSKLTNVGLLFTAQALTAIGRSAHVERCMPIICDRLASLKTEAKCMLAGRLTRHLLVASVSPGSVPAAAKEVFRQWIAAFQGFLMLKCVTDNDDEPITMCKDEAILNAVLVLDVLNKINEEIHFLSYEEFYNPSIVEVLNLKEEYPRWKNQQELTFLDFPFLLDSSTKGDVLKIESMISMRRELQDAFFRAMFIGVNSPYLHLEVRRDHVVRDAIAQLSSKTSNDLKKQLRVSFVGEEGIDEGGIQKEFYQIIVDGIFNPDHGMFETYPESRLCWFVRNVPDDERVLEEYALIGKLLGLATYNSVTLDIPFPLALFKKLLDVTPTLEDLAELDPLLGKGLRELLSTTETITDTYGWTFEVDLPSSLGSKVAPQKVLLKPGGEQIQLDVSNRHEFVKLYVDLLLTGSVKKGFDAFRKGFQSVIGAGATGSPSEGASQIFAITLFRPEEFRQLTVGSRELDIDALEKNAHYDGFEADSPCIQWFWEVVKSMTDGEKQSLLVFTTGSDRVPVGGLSRLPFVIARSGPDSDRLPTSHTCYNVLLLNEYATKEKLEERLKTALSFARCGFYLL